MAANFSFINDLYLGDPSLATDPYRCFVTGPIGFVIGSFFITFIILLFPLCIFILYFYFQQLQHKTLTSISHCDNFTYNMVCMEMIGILGSIISFCGNCIKNSRLAHVGLNIFYFPWYGHVFFHTLTCVERYLAVVHPITYLSLRDEKWIRVRNITIGFVWLFCFAGNTLVAIANIIYLDILLLTLSTICISFSSMTVLSVLIRSGPGDREEVRKRVDQSKLRAFYTIMVIFVVLLLRLSFGLITLGMELSERMHLCIITACSVWINLPTNLVLPLLFIQRTRK